MINIGTYFYSPLPLAYLKKINEFFLTKIYETKVTLA